MLTEPKYLGNDKVNFLKMVGGWVFVCFIVFLFYSLHNLNLGGLLWPRHESRPGAETSLPEWLPHLREEKQLHWQLHDAHAGRGEAALGEDEEEEGGDRHANQWEEEGQTKQGLRLEIKLVAILGNISSVIFYQQW